jgi:preprotein translocase subunit SecF
LKDGAMLNRLLSRSQTQTIDGHRLPEPRLTILALMWLLVYLALPLMVVGSLIDLAIQQVTGTCTGIWCWF